MRQISPSRRSRATSIATLPLLLLLGLVSNAGPAAAAADSPTVTPATGGGGVPVIFGHFDDLAAIDYQTTEFLISGNAHSYTSAVLPLPTDGKWSITANPATAAYTTRVVVHTPKKAKKFSGTVYVEWLNVSGAGGCQPRLAARPPRDRARGRRVDRRLRSARRRQPAEVCGAQSGLPGSRRSGSLRIAGPSRRQLLVRHLLAGRPGGLGWRRAGEPRAQGGHRAGRVAVGGTARHLHRRRPSLADVYDGFVVHSRGAGGAALSQAPLPSIPVLQTDIRDDLNVPTIVFQSEFDVANARLLARQTETPTGKFRLWEVAGTAHFDQYGLVIGLTDTGDGQGEIENLAAMQNPPRAARSPDSSSAPVPINTGPMHWVFNAAVTGSTAGLDFGTPPPIAPRLAGHHGAGRRPRWCSRPMRTATRSAASARRTSTCRSRRWLGTGNTGAPGAPPSSAFCSLFGQTVPFTDAELAALYPNQFSYVIPFLLSGLEAVRSRFLLLEDAILLFQASVESDIGK